MPSSMPDLVSRRWVWSFTLVLGRVNDLGRQLERAAVDSGAAGIASNFAFWRG